MRQTSIDCYNQIKASGLLSEIRLKVMKRVLQLAPCTATEVEKYMNIHDNMKGTWRVMTWLREADVVYEKGTRDCKVTGRNCIEWDLTDRLPQPVVKKITRPRSINKSIEYILAGMKVRGLDSISVEMLNKLKKKNNGTKTKKAT